MWVLMTILLMVASVAITFFFSARIVKFIYTALGKPYFKITFKYFHAGPGGVYVDAEFNNFFIYELERLYKQKGEEKTLEPLDDDEKVTVYLYDLAYDLAEDNLPEESVEDIGADIPMLGFRGGEEVKQVIDLGKEASKPGSKVDFVS